MATSAQRRGIVMEDRVHPPESDRGAVLVHTAFALLALIAFTTFVVDFGVMWLARGQAQNSADAAAMAGATALAYDSPGGCVPPPVVSSAQVTAQQNLVYGQPPVTAIQCENAIGQCEGRDCVRAEVYRDAAHDNPLPVFFGGLVGLSAPGIRAVAVAQYRPANTTHCMRPWVVVDRWDEYGSPPEPDYPAPDPDFLPNSTYDRYSLTSPEPDLHVPPTTTLPGTGMSVPGDYGVRMALLAYANSFNAASVRPGWLRAVRLPVGTYSGNVTACAGVPMSYAAPGSPACPSVIAPGTEAAAALLGCYPWSDANIVSVTQTAIQTLIGQDAGAYWDPTLNGGRGGIAGSCCTSSPRVVAVGIMDVTDYLSRDPNGFAGVVRVSNIVGFFVEGMGTVDPVSGAITCCSAGGDAVIGRLMVMPGTIQGPGPDIDDDGAFLRAVLLVR